jgi:competence protein ComEA
VDRNPADRKSSSKKEAQLTGPIDINQAPAAELQRLPGVGPKRAQLIIEERQKRPFASIEELRRVSGIGPKTLERLRPYIAVENGSVRIVSADGR